MRRRRVDQITIVDGTLIPTRDHRLAAYSKNYRYSANLQVAIDSHTRLVVALDDPQPGNRNDTIAYRTSAIDQKLAGRPVMADGAYRGNPDRSFIDHAFRNGAVPTAGAKILPPVSRFSADGGHGEKKQRVLTRLGVFFERFFGLSAGDAE